MRAGYELARRGKRILAAEPRGPLGSSRRPEIARPSDDREVIAKDDPEVGDTLVELSSSIHEPRTRSHKPAEGSP